MYVNRTFGWRLLAAGVALGALTGAANAYAADAAVTANNGPGAPATAEGAEVKEVVVTVEKDPAAKAAPTKASLDEMQPESIVTHKFIEQATPETGGWTTVALIAPSVSGITSNGGGIGDYNVVTMRGLKDGQFNVTYDGISFADTNDPTHHGADYWPSSTIGTAVVDRGPGAAGDLGQANFGGAFHFFSPEVADKFGVTQKLTYGSFDTKASVTTINTGNVAWLGGGKLLLNFDERSSDGELSHSGGNQFNQMAKYVLQATDKLTVTALYDHEWTRFNFEDSNGPGESWAQVAAFGKNYSMNSDPRSEHYTGYNYEKKQTDFAYIDAKYQATQNLSLENQLYEYFYSNKTISSNDMSGYLGPDQNGVPGTANTSAPNVTTAPQSASDIGGYTKLNDYHVYGDVVRLNQDWSFGTLKVGGLVEGSQTQRDNEFLDLSLGGVPDNKFTPPKYPFTSNDKLLENSDWFQGQLFADFYWHPLDNLTIAPGFKYVNFTRDVDAAHENVAGGTKNQSINASNTYTSPLYFLTANYKITHDWSVYGQYATSFLIPSLSTLYVANVTLQSLKPETTTNYQLGTVYTHGHITADADVYEVDASNLYNPCTVSNGVNDGAYCNFGKARYSGVEGEAAYAFNFGVTLFANGSVSANKQLANAANPAAGITANPARELANAPKWTAAGGVIYSHHQWNAALTYKQVGDYVDYGAATFHLPAYDTVNGSLGYDFGRFGLKLQVQNLLDRRQISSFTPGASAKLYDVTDAAAVYTFQAGRELSLTLVGKF